MLEVRVADTNDLNLLVELFDAYRVFYRKASDLDAAKTFLKDRIEKQESVIFIAIHNNTMVGFTQLYPSYSSTRMSRLWILNDLYLTPEARGKGFSKKLIQRAKDYAIETQATGILLETENSNLIGNRLYQKEKFYLEENNFYFWKAPQ